MSGVVTKVYAAPGQAVRVGDPLFDLQVTDEALAEAQLSLLDVLARIEVADNEISRLKPLTETGAVTGRRKRDLEYERQQLETQRAARLLVEY